MMHTIRSKARLWFIRIPFSWSRYCTSSKWQSNTG